VESRLSVSLFETSTGGVSETAFHWLKRRINLHQSNRSRATNNLVHKSEAGKKYPHELLGKSNTDSTLNGVYR
jgi:hypothetical protein